MTKLHLPYEEAQAKRRRLFNVDALTPAHAARAIPLRPSEQQGLAQRFRLQNDERAVWGSIFRKFLPRVGIVDAIETADHYVQIAGDTRAGAR